MHVWGVDALDPRRRTALRQSRLCRDCTGSLWPLRRAERRRRRPTTRFSVRMPRASIASSTSATSRCRALGCTQSFPGSKTGLIGFCMGGRIALLASIDDAGVFSAVCPFYGPLTDVDPAEDARPGLRELWRPRQEHSRAERARLRGCADRAQRLRIYDDAGHAFFDDQRPSYVAVAAEDAWARTLAFLASTWAGPRRDRLRSCWRAFSRRRRPRRLIAWLIARAENAALRATARSSRAIPAKRRSKRCWNAPRTSCASARRRVPSERVGELVSPDDAEARRVRPPDRRNRSEAPTRCRSLRVQIEQLLGRTDKLESATLQSETQTSTLVTALRNPASRGKWGEMQLRNVVEKAGMLPYCDFSEQQTVALEEARVRPDMTVNLPGERCVFVDAKAPIDAMQAALEAHDDEASRRRLVKQHARALRDHVDALARRGYQKAKGSADYVVMFVAGEAFLSSACSEDPMLIEYALDKGVLVTGPLRSSACCALRDGLAGAAAGRERQAHRDDRPRALRARAQVLRPPARDAQASRALGQRVQRRRRLVRDEAAAARTQAQRRGRAWSATSSRRFRRSTSCRAKLPRSIPARRRNACRVRNASFPTTTQFNPCQVRFASVRRLLRDK